MVQILGILKMYLKTLFVYFASQSHVGYELSNAAM